MDRRCFQLKAFKITISAILIVAVILVIGLPTSNHAYSRRLISAIQADNVAEVERLLKNPFGNVNSSDHFGLPYILQAVASPIT
jgi:hypothetical protein